LLPYNQTKQLKFLYFKSGFSSRETHNAGPDIYSGKTGHDLPVHEVATLDPEVFAAFTGPDGGLTSICNLGDKFSVSAMQV